jgi:hypothetical protein
MLEAMHGVMIVAHDWRQQMAKIADWKRRMADCRARASRLTALDPPEERSAIQAELDGLIAEWEQIGPASDA